MRIDTMASGPAEARFEFGENWRSFVQELGPERIETARDSLVEWLGEPSLAGLSFLDVGSGSGLFSLSAARLDAERVHSLDYDASSVETTGELKRRLAPDADWTIERGDVLDPEYMSSLGSWDIVYAWGVLHHTGDMWRALENTCRRVCPGGRLFISIYNDQGTMSKVWRAIKRLYNIMPRSLRVPYAATVMIPQEVRSLLGHTIRRRPKQYFRMWRRSGEYKRGMDRWHDLLDWAGGYPFEVATPQQVFEFCAARGFELRKLRTVGGSNGCNQFVFERMSA